MVTPRSLHAYALMAGVLALGSVIGGGATFAYMRAQAGVAAGQDSPRVRRERVAALARELDLTEAQRSKIEAILEASREERSKRTRAMYEACGEPVREHKRRIDAEIRATLSPEQQGRFDALAEEQAKKYFPPRVGRPEDGGEEREEREERQERRHERQQEERREQRRDEP